MPGSGIIKPDKFRWLKPTGDNLKAQPKTFWNHLSSSRRKIS